MAWKDPDHLRGVDGHYSACICPGCRAKRASVVEPRPTGMRKTVVVRQVTYGGRTYASVDAHALLEAEDYTHAARPGRPLG